MSRIEIHYRRPPDRLDVYIQQLVVDGPECKITLHENTPLTEPLQIGSTRIYEPGAPLVWFVFPGAWHDIGRFHLADGTFTGYYVNLIAPVRMDGDVWSMYDLCLDLWVDADGSFQVLDQGEFDEAVDLLWIDPATAQRARREMEQLLVEVRAGKWPPGIVGEYDLERVRRISSDV